jgi:hypothetical protein
MAILRIDTPIAPSQKATVTVRLLEFNPVNELHQLIAILLISMNNGIPANGTNPTNDTIVSSVANKIPPISPSIDLPYSKNPITASNMK